MIPKTYGKIWELTRGSFRKVCVLFLTTISLSLCMSCTTLTNFFTPPDLLMQYQTSSLCTPLFTFTKCTQTQGLFPHFFVNTLKANIAFVELFLCTKSSCCCFIKNSYPSFNNSLHRLQQHGSSTFTSLQLPPSSISPFLKTRLSFLLACFLCS